MNIQQPLFEKAFIDGKYSKPEFVEILNELITPETLSETDEVVLGSVLFSINDASTNQLNIINLIRFINLNNTNAAKLLTQKILLNPQIKSEYDSYKATNKKKQRKWAIGYSGLLLVVACAVGYKTGYIKLPVPTATDGAKVVVIDTARLAYAASVPYINQNISPEQAQQISIQYRDSLQREIQSYVDKGYIIINRSSVYVTSPKNDITDNVIKAVGLKPIGIDRFDADYTNEQKYNVLKSFAQSHVSDYEQAVLAERTNELNKAAEAQIDKENIIVDETTGQSIDLQ